MNDAADEPSRPTSAERELRTVSDEELRSILEKHEQWVAAEDKTGLDHLRADLSWADLRAYGAILKMSHLQQANLRGINLQNADVTSAQLQGAQLHEAELQGAILVDAQLQGTHLISAQLQNAILTNAQLQGAELQAADLTSSQLQGANLRGAQLQGANLYKAQLRGAYVEGAMLEAGTAIISALGRMEVLPANVTDADFRDADLSNAQLSAATGLRAEMLAGAVLTNAKLPDDIKTFDQLKHVEETSRNAITVFFGLLAASLYSWLTIATTTDLVLITGTASSPLPIINTNIALSGFYLAAPLILLAVYFYFHLYLQRLWGDLASPPGGVPGWRSARS
jgi:uncharacterized protein YjbI with pentapeptide repeats